MAYSANVLSNASFETGDYYYADYWTQDGGDYLRSTDAGSIPAARDAHTGSYGGGSDRGNNTRNAYQDFDLTTIASAAELDAGSIRINAGGWLVRGEAGYDDTKIVVQILNSSGVVIATPLDSGWHTSTTWTEYSVSDYVIPTNGRTVRVRGYAWEDGAYEAGTYDDFYVQWENTGGGGETNIVRMIL